MNETFDINEFIDEIISEMGMSDAPEEKLEPLKMSMLRQVNETILKTASIYIEPEMIETVMMKNEGEDNILFIIRDLIKNSPAAQEAILEELDDFKAKTLETYARFKN